MQDANFNLTSIASISGAVAERYLFDPYGNRTIMSATWGIISASAYSWDIGPQGLVLDLETALIYNRGRYVIIVLATFCGRDPIPYSGGANLYEYELSNPVNLPDPSGLHISAPNNGGMWSTITGAADAVGSAVSTAFQISSSFISVTTQLLLGGSGGTSGGSGGGAGGGGAGGGGGAADSADAPKSASVTKLRIQLSK
jgi:RHS repeat-associated protein